MTTDADANSKSNQASIAKEKASPAKRRAERAERIFALAYNSRYDGFKSLATASRPLAVLAKVFDEFLFELDADGRFLGIWSSRQPLKIGRQTDFIGRHAMEVLGEDVFLPFSEVLHRVIATHEADGIEFPVDLEDGRHWFYARVLPVGRTLGKRPSVSLLAHDITAQKETEDELRKSQALLAQAEQLVNMGSWEVDASLGTVLCSDNLYRILGVDHRKCENDRPNIAQNVPPDDVVEAQKRLQAAITEGTPFEHDFRCISAAGLRHFHALGFPLRDSEGRVVRVVGVTEDVTDRLNVEERLRRVSDQLLTLRDEEHRRMARDLHETVSQEMAALKMTLGHSSGSHRLLPAAPAVARRSRTWLRAALVCLGICGAQRHPSESEQQRRFRPLAQRNRNRAFSRGAGSAYEHSPPFQISRRGDSPATRRRKNPHRGERCGRRDGAAFRSHRLEFPAGHRHRRNARARETARRHVRNKKQARSRNHA